MSWLVIASFIVLLVVIIPIALPLLISHFLTKKWAKHQISNQIRRKTRVGNMLYVINWIIVVGWIGIFSHIVTRVDNWLSVESILGFCIMMFSTVMLTRELYQSYKSRNPSDQK